MVAFSSDEPGRYSRVVPRPLYQGNTQTAVADTVYKTSTIPRSIQTTGEGGQRRELSDACDELINATIVKQSNTPNSDQK
jgi:hypothetical protein